jgi:hypothetical protein
LYVFTKFISGEKMFEHADYARPMPNMLSAVHDKLHEHAKPYVVALSEALISLDSQKKYAILHLGS